MRIPSAYKVYQVVFEYPQGPDGTRISFGRAIAETLPVISDMMESHSTSPIAAYQEQPYARSLAVQFLDHFLELADARSGDFLNRWAYAKTIISLNRSLFPYSRKRGLDIEFPYLVGPGQSEIIIPTFGSSENMGGELGVFLTLCGLGTVRPSIPARVRTITYWDLLHGAASSVEKARLTPVDQRVVLAACSELMAS